MHWTRTCTLAFYIKNVVTFVESLLNNSSFQGWFFSYSGSSIECNTFLVLHSLAQSIFLYSLFQNIVSSYSDNNNINTSKKTKRKKNVTCPKTARTYDHGQMWRSSFSRRASDVLPCSWLNFRMITFSFVFNACKNQSWCHGLQNNRFHDSATRTSRVKHIHAAVTQTWSNKATNQVLSIQASWSHSLWANNIYIDISDVTHCEPITCTST